MPDSERFFKVDSLRVNMVTRKYGYNSRLAVFYPGNEN